MSIDPVQSTKVPVTEIILTSCFIYEIAKEKRRRERLQLAAIHPNLCWAWKNPPISLLTGNKNS